MSVIHTYLTKEGESTEKLTKARAIRKYCLMCGGWSFKEVEECTATKCPLYPFRFGNEKGLLPAEERRRKTGKEKEQKKEPKKKILRRLIRKKGD